MIDTSGDQYVKNGTTILVDKTSGNNGTPPDVQYIVSGSNTTGWEASIGGLAPGNYTLRFEAHVTGNNTSGTGPGGTSVILDPCNPTAVTVNSFDANSESVAAVATNGLGILGLGLAGVFTLGLVSLFAIRRK